MLKVEQITAAGDGVEDRNNLAPLPVRTQRASRCLGLTGPRIFCILAFAVAEFLAGPERVGLMRYSAGCRKVGLAPLFVGGHGTGHGVQLFEVAYPEIFIDVDVAMVALGGAAVGAEKAQFGPRLAVFAQHNWVAGQFQAEPFLCKRNDVAAKNFGLGAAGRQENLIVAGEYGVHECFAGEVVGQAHLTTFKNVADATGQWVLFGGEQLFLIPVHLADELVQKVDFSQLTHFVFGFFLALLAAFVAALPPVPAFAALSFPAMAVVRRRFSDRGRCRFDGLLQQPLANGGQPVQFVQVALGQRRGFVQEKGNSATYRRQRFFIREHVFPAALANPVIDDPDVGQVELRLNFLGLTAAQKQAFGGFFNFG